MGLLIGVFRNDRVVTGLFLLVLTIILSSSGALFRVDNLIYDFAQKKSHRVPPADVVIVAIDEDSLSELGRWPWSRTLHAQLIERLHQGGAKAIGLDMLFSEPQVDDPRADMQLSQAMQKAGNVVLPVVIEQVRMNGPLVENLPIPLLSAQAKALGRIHVELDTDSIARSIVLREGVGQAAWGHFAQAMLISAGQWPYAVSSTSPSHFEPTDSTILVQSEQRYINFSSGSQHFSTMSYAQVLKGQYLPDAFRDKLVLVGATAVGLADGVATPISGLREPTAGVELLANAVVSMREQTLVRLSPRWLTLLLACVLTVLPLVWLSRTKALAGMIITVVYGAIVLLVGLYLPLVLFCWVPLSAALAGILSSYPLWALRKLLSATSFMDHEIKRLGQELAKWPTQENFEVNSDPFQTRILHIQKATNRLMKLEQEQREALAYISHDIRAPIASAAAQAKQELGDQSALHRQLVKVLNFTETFLQVSRAEILDQETFEYLDVVDLLHQLMDEFYPLANEQDREIEARLPPDTVWVWGHFGSLSRAIGNLLGNAIKFSPPHSRIQLDAHCTERTVQITVTDAGLGIAKEDLGQIFQRFGQLKPRHANRFGGVGLGLYYVETVALKHKASIEVRSQPGSTSFMFTLPLQKIPL